MNKLQHYKLNDRYKIKDTPENRNLIQEIAGQRRTYHGISKYGCDWHALILPDGRQIWVLVWNNQIYNARINDFPYAFHPLWGFSESSLFNKKPKEC